MQNQNHPVVVPASMANEPAVIHTMKAEWIAPCGMNCRLCYAFWRKKNPCTGCRSDDSGKPAYCITCVIKTCAHHQTGSGWCYDCESIPCKRLKDLDKRYRTKYHMSMLQNLRYIKENGMAAFLVREKQRWSCPDCGQIVSVHKQTCDSCGRPVADNAPIEPERK